MGDFYVHHAGEFDGEGELLRWDFEGGLHMFRLHRGAGEHEAAAGFEQFLFDLSSERLDSSGDFY